jgi:hypothetical protein
MGMKLTFTNIFQFLSGISPFLLGFFLVMSSVFNQNVKGIIYLAGVILASMINILLMNLIGQKSFPQESLSCNLIDLPFGSSMYNSPALTSVFIGFTIAYLFLPMNHHNEMNYILLISLFALFVIDGVTKVINYCTNVSGIVLGGLIGGLLGSVWYSIFHISGNDSLLFFDEMISNKVVCKKPSKQKFKCSVYKNGELVKIL